MKKTFLILAAAFAISSVVGQLPYKDASLSVDERVDDLMSRMTNEEKIQQMTILILGDNDNPNNIESEDDKWTSPMTGAYIFRTTDVDWVNYLQRDAMENSRLGIPVLLGYDVIHGYKTLFPIPLAQSCAWDADMVYKSSRVAAKEAYVTGIRWTFSPMIDVARDPRWGRVAESYGEDPYANSVFGVSAVNGYQGDKLSDKYSIASCVKHFAGYSYSQGGRDYNPTQVSDLSMWETVFPPYKACVEAGVATVMSSFNDLNGVPAVANRFLLKEVLRDRWNFDGFVVSDWRAIEQLFNQGFAADSLDAGAKALRAGNDMDMYDDIYNNYMEKALEIGRITQEDIDVAVRPILKTKFELGLFEDPYVKNIPEKKRYHAKEDVELAKRAAEQTMVLLKNENSVLPLSSATKRVLLVGPMAKDTRNLMGTWTARATEDNSVSIYDGLRAEFGKKVDIEYVDGAGLESNEDGFIKRALASAKASDVIVIALGEYYKWSGENGSVATIELPDSQNDIVKELSKSGKPIVVLLSSGRPLGLMEIEPLADAIVCMWQPGHYGGPAVGGILSGRVNPSAKLSITFPLLTGQIPTFYNYRQNARVSWTRKGERTNGRYADYHDMPLYEFGHGLSYSTFEYSPIKASKSEFKAGESVELSVEVKNTSSVDGIETALWFVWDRVASVSKPVKKLKHFEKQMVKAGESVTYTFTIDPMRDLSFVDRNGDSNLEAGDFVIYVADQKIDLKLVE